MLGVRCGVDSLTNPALVEMDEPATVSHEADRVAVVNRHPGFGQRPSVEVPEEEDVVRS